MLKDFTLSFLEKITNRALRLDPQTAQRLSALSGKIILLRLIDWLDIYICIQEQGVQLRQYSSEKPDTTIESSVTTLFKLRNSSVIPAGQLHIHGDLELGQQLRDIARSLQIDWEEVIARYTGDIAAHQIGNTARSIHSWLRHSRTRLCENLSDYLQTEANYLPHKTQVEDFINEVSELRHAVDRLEARWQQLLHTDTTFLNAE
jgi:ubiquinone biosynthesis protein UbiJ